MDKELEKVEITFSEGTHETYTKDVLVMALGEDGGVACRGSFRCKVGDAIKVGMAMVMEAGRIFEKNTKREGGEEMRLEEEEGDGFDFSKFF